jgi:1,2-dihydroxy-3-keto-5-methylthiopentene dioxygenase
MTTTVTHFNATTGSQVAHYRDPGIITTQLASLGIRFERWETPVVLAPTAEDAAILAAYRPAIERLQAEGGYHTVDCIHMRPDHPQKTEMRAKFLNEHTHSEDEVRFFVEGRGLFCLHVGEEVLQVLCERNDWIAVPAGTRHWFDMGAEPQFCALRFFANPDGWVANFTGDAIAHNFPLLDELLGEQLIRA